MFEALHGEKKHLALLGLVWLVSIAMGIGISNKFVVKYSWGASESFLHFFLGKRQVYGWMHLPEKQE